jgi:hypothetical protein
VGARINRITVRNTPEIYTNTVQVHVGTGVGTPASDDGAGAGAGVTSPGGAGTSRAAPSCQSPRMSIALTRKPLRRQRNGVPVLVFGKPYRFSGRVTCVVARKRVGAPVGLPVEVLHQVGRRLVRKPSSKTARNGRVAVNMRVYAKRVLVFRVRGARREIVQVRIRVAVIKR